MYERIRINNPDTYEHAPIGKTIDRYAEQYGIDPSILFFLAYIDSWYGEAASGPVPFASAMTPETIRDLVQAHLPAWFVESRARSWLITSPLLQNVVGESLGLTLRYAVHKTTLDISTAPYAINTFSDTFLVLKEFPEEFPDVLLEETSDPVTLALRNSFRQLKNSALLRDYEAPYKHRPYDEHFYSANRRALKQFTRAAFYKTLLDFDFATRIQVLLSSYQRDYFIKTIGQTAWQALPPWQQASMLVMIRDLYMPNIGRPAYNAYALPELNATPLEFVAQDARQNADRLGALQVRIWRPREYERLWAGAGYRLRVFSDVWMLAHGHEIPGLAREPTVDDARLIVRSHKQR